MIKYLFLGATAAFTLAPAAMAERGGDGDVKISTGRHHQSSTHIFQAERRISNHRRS